MESTWSFGPSGSYSLFNAGVAYYVRQHIPFDRERTTIYTVSGGALGLALLTHSSPEEIVERSIASATIMGELQRYRCPPLHMRQHCLQALDAFFPDDAHLTLRGKHQIGLTQLPSLRSKVLDSNFTTKAEFLEALMASAYIPGYFLNLPHLQYWNMVDGGFSHSFCTRSTLTVSPSQTLGSDIYYGPDLGHHLSLASAEEYLQIFQRGIVAAHRNHALIERRLGRVKPS